MNEMPDTTLVEHSLIQNALQAGIPINGSLELLPLCNMNCDMCYVRLDREEMEHAGSLRTLEEWLSLAEEMKNAGTLFLLLTGGEPLLYPDFRRLYTELLSLGMIITINTNGTLLDEEWADFFARQKPRRINLTLYGSNEETYERLCHYRFGYQKAIRAISLLKERNIDVKVGCSAVYGNETDIEHIFSIGKELSVPVHIDSYMYPASRERTAPYDKNIRFSPKKAASIWFRDLRQSMSDIEYEAYRKQLFQMSKDMEKEPSGQYIPGTQCMAGNCSFTVNWQGELRPCVMLSEPSFPVFEIGFEHAWQNLRKALQKIFINPECNACSLRPFCRICPASALYEGGSYDRIPEYLCRFAEASCQFLKGDIVHEK